MTAQIVVGVDGSESALHATRWAAHEAALRDADVRLVHVRQLPLLLPPKDLYAKELTEQGRKWLRTAHDVALQASPSLDVHAELRTGQPGEQLVAETEDAGLVVVGSRGLGGFRSLLLGSVANALTAHGHCPVVVMRGRKVGAAPPDSGPVVVGADGSPSSDNALAFALAAAAARGVEVLALMAWSYESLSDAWLPATAVVDWDEITAAQRRQFSDQLAKVRAGYPEVPVRTEEYRGRPADGLLEHAEEAQLVVVGAHGRHRFPAGALGSTSYTVLHHATCPVAVVGGQGWPS